MISRRNIAAISGIILSAAALAAVPTMPDDDGAKSQCRQHVACDMDDADTRWKINEEGQIEWDVKAGEVPHSDHFEMSAEQIACVLRCSRRGFYPDNGEVARLPDAQENP